MARNACHKDKSGICCHKSKQQIPLSIDIFIKTCLSHHGKGMFYAGVSKGEVARP